MVITEAMLTSWLSANFPSVLIGLITATTFIAIYLRLRVFLDRMDKAETELVKVSKSLYRLKLKVNQIVLFHCRMHKEDLESLMKMDPEDQKDE